MRTMKDIISTYKDLAGFLVFIASLLQFGIIAANFIQGLYEGFTPAQITGIAVSRSLAGFVSSLVVAIPLIILIKWLDLLLPWGEKTFFRIFAEFFAVIIVSFGITIVVYALADHFSEEFRRVDYSLVKGTIIYSITNLLFISSLEGYMFYKAHKRGKLEEAILRDEIAGIRLNILKSQMNQHFMFNSLNVLSGLLKRDPERAEIFIQEFSGIYRYVLETIELPVVKLERELEFLRSYIYLQQIRHGSSLIYKESVTPDVFDMELPPLALQTLLENAIKHNIVNSEHPLVIDIYNEGESIVVRNNYQPKLSLLASTGLGQKNVRRRYRIICEKRPEFILKDGYYKAVLPLIN